ncbi:hypothetical protein B0H12DRAFT_1113039 [Mycena haematopus]|nr:hypothetical protein B0H12DRAFT_1113039 [Mycena haematopus]
MSRDSPLDPGVPARKRRSFCRLCMYICLAFFGLFLAILIYGIGKGLLEITQFSHSRIFQNQTLEEVENRATVVRPLVDGTQSFDIAVSIWALPVEDTIGENSNDASETPLYSDIVFRGLHLADKHKSVNLTYKLPISIFQRLLLKENDLRASFVLIPSAPSLVDQITNFSTWRPESLTIPPVRSWPFPLRTADNGPQGVPDRALDSFGISMPLLEFHEFGSKCIKSPISETQSAEENTLSDDDKENEDEYEDEDEEPINVEEDAAGGPSGVSDISKYPEHTLKRHPFVITRTQIRVVDETHIFSRKLYDREHNKLRSTACGQGRDKKPDLNSCRRTYEANGNWETRLQLQVPDKETGEPSTEWAYAPYIGHATFSAGPMDIVPIPVTRENCTQFENASSTDPEFIEINWRLSYSGRSPAKYVGFASIRPPKRVSYNESDFKKVIAQEHAGLINGVAGHRFYEDDHPRRRFIINILLLILSPIQDFLSTSYWYTRTSTVSISASGTTFLALHRVLSALTQAANAVETQKLKFATMEWWWVIASNVAIEFLVASCMLTTVTRLAFSLNSRWIPSVRRVNPTHMERTSQRLDSRTSWRIKVGVCVSLIAVNYVSVKYYSFNLFGYHVLPPLHPTPGPTDRTTVSNPFARAYVFSSLPLVFMGNLSQFLLNQRSKMFAGRYKITVAVGCISAILELIKYLPSVIGRFDARPGLSVTTVVVYVMLAAMAWQAVAFPKVSEKTEEEDSE